MARPGSAEVAGVRVRWYRGLQSGEPGAAALFRAALPRADPARVGGEPPVFVLQEGALDRGRPGCGRGDRNGPVSTGRAREHRREGAGAGPAPDLLGRAEQRGAVVRKSRGLHPGGSRAARYDGDSHGEPRRRSGWRGRRCDDHHPPQRQSAGRRWRWVFQHVLGGEPGGQ
ncbi:unnamed protein product [Amoebophrya sp. A120]|nr:unnamed protein product [Amoebophrya sp. A120]|eukprot:GSA120T00003579001.1